jgi:hypothetical protein
MKVGRALLHCVREGVTNRRRPNIGIDRRSAGPDRAPRDRKHIDLRSLNTDLASRRRAAHE